MDTAIRMSERDRLLAAMIAMCLVAGVIALRLHPHDPFGSLGLEQGSLTAPASAERLHESAAAGGVPPAVGLTATDARGDAGETTEPPSPSPSPPNKPTPPNEPPPPGDLISQLLSELPQLPPPPVSATRHGAKVRR